jgi:hypothetical protein
MNAGSTSAILPLHVLYVAWFSLAGYGSGAGDEIAVRAVQGGVAERGGVVLGCGPLRAGLRSWRSLVG